MQFYPDESFRLEDGATYADGAGCFRVVTQREDGTFNSSGIRFDAQGYTDDAFASRLVLKVPPQEKAFYATQTEVVTQRRLFCLEELRARLL